MPFYDNVTIPLETSPGRLLSNFVFSHKSVSMTTSASQTEPDRLWSRLTLVSTVLCGTCPAQDIPCLRGELGKLVVSHQKLIRILKFRRIRNIESVASQRMMEIREKKKLPNKRFSSYYFVDNIWISIRLRNRNLGFKENTLANQYLSSCRSMT